MSDHDQKWYDALGDRLERATTPIWKALHLWDAKRGTVYTPVSWFQHAIIALALGWLLSLTPWLNWWQGTAIFAGLYWIREVYQRTGGRRIHTGAWWPDGIMDALLPTLAAVILWLMT